MSVGRLHPDPEGGRARCSWARLGIFKCRPYFDLSSSLLLRPLRQDFEVWRLLGYLPKTTQMRRLQIVSQNTFLSFHLYDDTFHQYNYFWYLLCQKHQPCFDDLNGLLNSYYYVAFVFHLHREQGDLTFTLIGAPVCRARLSDVNWLRSGIASRWGSVQAKGLILVGLDATFQIPLT